MKNENMLQKYPQSGCNKNQMNSKLQNHQHKLI